MGSLAATPTLGTAGSCPCAPGASPGEGHSQGSSLRVPEHPARRRKHLLQLLSEYHLPYVKTCIPRGFHMASLNQPEAHGSLWTRVTPENEKPPQAEVRPHSRPSRPRVPFRPSRRNAGGWQESGGHLIKRSYIWRGLAISGQNLHLLLTHLTSTLARGASEHHLPSAQPVT